MTRIRIHRAMWAALLAALLIIPTMGGAAVAGSPLAVVKVELFYDGAWHDISADVRTDTPVNITRGIANEGSRAEPASVTLLVNNGRSNVAPDVIGRYSPRNPRSDLYGKIGRGTPLRVSAGLGAATSTRAVVEITKLPVRWNPAGTVVWVPLEASGILRRLGLPGSPVRSAARRYVDHYLTPVAYWSMEDGTDAQQFANAVPGGPPLQVTAGSQQLAADDTLPGSAPLPVAQKDSTAYDQLVFRAPVSIPGGQFSVSWWDRARFVSGENGFAASTVVVHVTGSPHIAEWHFGISRNQATGQDTFRAFAVASPGDVVPVAGYKLPFPTDAHSPEWRHIRATVDMSGGQARTRLHVDGNNLRTDLDSISLGNVTGITFQVGVSPSDREALVSFGHLAVFDNTQNLFDLFGALGAGHGYPGELAGRRAARLCAEDGIPLETVGDLDATMPMGPQRPAAILDLLDECATAEAGGVPAPVLTESRDQLGLRWVCRSEFYLTDTT